MPPAFDPATLGGVLYADPARMPVSEQEWALLVRAIGTGDQFALHALYQRTHRIVFTLVLRITGNEAAAEQLTVDVFHDAWLGASGYDADDGTVLAWLMNLARARAIGHLHAGQSSTESRPAPERPPTDAPPVAIVRADLHDARSRLRSAALESLAPDERATIEAVFFSGMTRAEVAERLNQPPDAVGTRIRAALHRLRIALASGGSGE